MQTSLVCLCLCLLSTALTTPVSMAFPGFPATAGSMRCAIRCILACFQQWENIGCSCVHHLWCLGNEVTLTAEVTPEEKIYISTEVAEHVPSV